MKAPYSAAVLFAAACTPLGAAWGKQPGAELTIASATEDVPEAVLGPRAPGGVRPDNMPQVKDADKTWLNRFGGTIGADWTTAYISRGFVQEDRGFILQPYANLSYELFKNEDVTLNANFTNWNSFHDRGTNSTKSDRLYRRYYEADYVAGASVALGKWTAGATYGWMGSPSEAMERVEEATMAVSYDDSDLLGAWSLKPSAQLTFETGPGFGDGLGRGVYLQLGIVPGFDIELSRQTTVRVDFPITAGFSVHNYYQDASGKDQVFGFAQVGAKISVPLPLPESCGRWTVNAAASLWIMNDHPAATNGGKDTQWVFSSGVSLAF